MSQFYSSPIPNKDKPVQNQNIVVKDRKSIEITGVKHVESFDHEEFLLETVLGYLTVRGSGLKMQNLNVDQGQVLIEGHIIEISYLDDQGGEAHKGFFSKLFR
ncbi:sporulation protein YabP [Sporolactobacillus inulinus]|uniref:Forespore shell protein n=2 Tax=Sporolactobacillus inulinus TaxID=2078 RepID=A0A4Y3T8S3_9BACL|nr:sporulation protein YabP [Sporolactobacillus inulinus]KLI01588.1 spore coat protein [Sporolactobacillus inulinus CASD]GAY77658.1 forespore shell protein [Sporolactobacillus inulinus]GEB78208.1 sporulation protein YabP [Sporolactobacillus inulinus]